MLKGTDPEAVPFEFFWATCRTHRSTLPHT
jgi:hypothetical protein